MDCGLAWIAFAVAGAGAVLPETDLNPENGVLLVANVSIGAPLKGAATLECVVSDERGGQILSTERRGLPLTVALGDGSPLADWAAGMRLGETRWAVIPAMGLGDYDGGPLMPTDQTLVLWMKRVPNR